MPEVRRRERRHVIVLIGEEELFSILLWKQGSYVCLPEIQGLPDDVLVEGIQHDWRSKSFGIILWHESFDLVPPGQEIPIKRPSSSHAYEIVQRRFGLAIKDGENYYEEARPNGRRLVKMD